MATPSPILRRIARAPTSIDQLLKCFVAILERIIRNVRNTSTNSQRVPLASTKGMAAAIDALKKFQIWSFILSAGVLSLFRDARLRLTLGATAVNALYGARAFDGFESNVRFLMAVIPADHHYS
jgi:hypothetical protein